MSSKAKELLDEYLEGLQATGTEIRGDVEAHSVAQDAIEELSQSGVSAAEILAAADGNLLEYIRNTLVPHDGAD